MALAVDCERGTFTREVETGLGGDRVGNMVRFAEEGLKLLREVIVGESTRGAYGGKGFVSKSLTGEGGGGFGGRSGWGGGEKKESKA